MFPPLAVFPLERFCCTLLRYSSNARPASLMYVCASFLSVCFWSVHLRRSDLSMFVCVGGVLARSRLFCTQILYVASQKVYVYQSKGSVDCAGQK